MKYGTILRVARLILVIAIVAMMIIPLVGSIASTNAEKMTAGVESRYDLEAVNDSIILGPKMIDVNLNLIDGPKDSFYIGIDDREPVLKSFDDASAYIFEQKLEGAKVASIYDTDKKICMQPAVQYHNGITTTVITGMKLPDNVMGLASFSVSMNLVSDVVNFNIPFGSSYIKDGYILLKTEIPDIVMFLANSFDHNMAVKVNVTIAGVASFYVNLDMFTSHSVTPTVTSDHEMSFRNAAIGSYMVFLGDNVLYHYDSDGNVALALVPGSSVKPLSESITRDANGDIPVEYFDDISAEEGTQGKISGEYYDEIVNILKYLEVHHV